MSPVSAENGECSFGAHHWRLAPAGGPQSLGRCRKCKAEKMFLNSAPSPVGYIEIREMLNAIHQARVSSSPRVGERDTSLAV